MRMKLLVRIVWIVLVSGLAACSTKKEGAGEEHMANDADNSKPAAVDQVARGEALVKSNDCNTCHHKTNTVIGPAHLKVAEKYEFTEANVKLLAEKIMKGGSGVWGPVPMAAHVDLSESDAEAMARYVLSLDGEKEH